MNARGYEDNRELIEVGEDSAGSMVRALFEAAMSEDLCSSRARGGTSGVTLSYYTCRLRSNEAARRNCSTFWINASHRIIASQFNYCVYLTITLSHETQSRRIEFALEYTTSISHLSCFNQNLTFNSFVPVYWVYFYIEALCIFVKAIGVKRKVEQCANRTHKTQRFLQYSPCRYWANELKVHSIVCPVIYYLSLTKVIR